MGFASVSGYLLWRGTHVTALVALFLANGLFVLTCASLSYLLVLIVFEPMEESLEGLIAKGRRGVAIKPRRERGRHGSEHVTSKAPYVLDAAPVVVNSVVEEVALEPVV